MYKAYHLDVNRIGGVIVNMLVSSVVDIVLDPPRLGQTNNYKIDICCFSNQHTVLRSKNEEMKTGCLGIRIMCLSGVRCLYADCCFSELAL